MTDPMYAADHAQMTGVGLTAEAVKAVLRPVTTGALEAGSGASRYD